MSIHPAHQQPLFSATWNTGTCLRDAFTCPEGYSMAFWMKVNSGATGVYDTLMWYGRTRIVRNGQLDKVIIKTMIKSKVMASSALQCN